MPRLGLKEEEEVGVLLQFSVVWIMALRCVDFLEVLLYLVLLQS